MSTAASRPAFDTPAARLQVVAMGVSGSGKSSVAEGMAEALGLHYIDGDDLHSAANVAKMSAGTPLTDEDRWPWLQRVGEQLADASRWPGGVIVACSALKRVYRDRIRDAAPGVRFVFLDGSVELIGERMRERSNHYMPPELLASQCRTLERPHDDEIDVRVYSIDQPLDALVAAAVATLRSAQTKPAAASD